MRTPPIRRIQSRWSSRNWPSALNETPSATKTIENPTTKASAWPRIRRLTRADSSPVRSATDIPVMNDRYEGKSGSTHGDRNEKSPALNETATPTDSPMAYLSSPSISEWDASLSHARGPSASAVRLPFRSTMKLEGRNGNLTALALGPRAWDNDATHSLI